MHEAGSGDAPTPRRSGRLRGAASPVVDHAPLRSSRSLRSSKQLTAISEEAPQHVPVQDEQQHFAESSHEQTDTQAELPGSAAQPYTEPEPQQLQQPGPAITADVLPSGAVVIEATAQAHAAVEQNGGGAAAAAAGTASLPPARPPALSVAERLAEQMFAALQGMLPQQEASNSEDDNEEHDQQQHGLRGQQQRQQQEQQLEAGRSTQHERNGEGVQSPSESSGGTRCSGDESGAPGHAASDAAGQFDGAEANGEGSDGGSSGDSGDEGSGLDTDSAEGQVPAHLRWRPELMLPDAAGSNAGPTSRRAAQQAAALSAPGVHVVRRGKDGLHVPPPDARALLRAARKDAPDTAGSSWYDLPATQITDEVKNDLRMLRLRGALDPKTFYKKFDGTKFPKYFQMGTVVEGPTDFFTGRLTNKQRKRTFTEEIMADAELAQVRKKRYTKLQEERMYWSKKKTGRKTDNERRKKPHRRAKH